MSGRESAGVGVPQAGWDDAVWLAAREADGLAPGDLPRLFGIDPTGLAAPARVGLLVLLERAKGMAEAAQAPVLVALDDPGADPVHAGAVAAGLAGPEDGFVAEEVAAALHLAPVTAVGRVERAHRLCGPCAPMLAALAAGVTGPVQARDAAEGTRHLDDATAAAVCTRLAADPGLACWTPGQFRARLARAVLAAAPDSADTEAVAERAARRVVRYRQGAGMATRACQMVCVSGRSYRRDHYDRCDLRTGCERAQEDGCGAARRAG